MRHAKHIKQFIILLASILTPFFCAAQDIGSSSFYNISGRCAAKVEGSGAGSQTCLSWQRGSQINYKGLADVGTCICGNDCLKVPDHYYYYDDPVAKTKQTDKNNIKLPVVLAWDDVSGWQYKDGQFLYWIPTVSMGGQESITSDSFGAKSYLLEIDNTYGVINDSKSAGGIFRRILKKNEFNPTKEFYPCFFNSGRVIKWRVRPCCYEDGSHCLPEDLAPWETFTTSYAPEPIIASDPDWNGSKGAANIPFKGFQINWCRVFLPMQKQYAKSYLLEISSNESDSGKFYCHPLLVSDNACKAESVLADRQSGEVYYTTGSDNISRIPYPTKNLGRQDIAFFTRNRTYTWRVRTCFDETAARCSDFGQAWKFSTKTDTIGVPESAEPKNDPNGDKPTGLPINLSWTIPDGANSFVYETSFTEGEQKTTAASAPNITTANNIKKLFDANNIKADTQYKWRAKACAKFDSTDCDNWSEWFVFRTTGRPVKTSSMAATTNIPATLSWEAVPGAKSYNLNIAKQGETSRMILVNNESIANSPEVTLSYPDINQGQSYIWKVQTCAHADGTICGAWSEESKFTIAPLSAAKNPQPGDKAIVYADQLTHQISWDQVTGALAYSYVINLTEPAEKDACAPEDAIIDRVANTTKDTINLKCLGKYRFTVEPCVDAKCESRGPISQWEFTLSQKDPGNKLSLAVCSTGYNNPNTPWNERETCQPKHLLLLVKIIIDFLLFRLSILILPLLVLITGLIYYTQFRTPDTWGKTKLMWKAVGIGYALMIFAWVIVGILLQIAGFSGLWYKIL